MNYNPKVVSIERSAAYVHHRAMKNRRENNPVDALELLRQAVQQSPENREYRLDLAELYCEMGCHEQSNRILLDMLAGGDAPAECYYGLALNRLGRNETDAARRALALYHSHARDDAYMEDAHALSAELDLFDAMKRPLDRKKGRASAIAMRACDAMKADDAPSAIRLFERSLRMDATQLEMRALYALALRLSGENEAALEQAAICANDAEASPRAICVAAQVYHYCGDRERAHALAQRAIAMRPDGVELRLMIFALSEMGMAEQAADALKAALRETPHDKMLLHMRAAALHRIGWPDDALATFWARILRIDPEDTVARFYYDAALEGRLADAKPGFVYEVPNAEFRRRLLLIADALGQGLTEAVKRWREDADFRCMLMWAAGTRDENCGRAAVMVIASADDEESESIVRELLYRGDIPIAVKLHAAFFLRLRGADMQKLLPPDMDVQDGMLPEPAELLEEMPVGERQLVRFADEVLSREYGVTACSALTLMWKAYRHEWHGSRDPLVCTQEAAAALAWNYLLAHGRQVKPAELAAQFGCRMRRMVFYARHMASVLEKYEGNNSDEDH